MGHIWKTTAGRTIGIVGCLVSLAGCVTIQQPADQSTQLDPFDIVVVWSTSMAAGTFYAKLDGQDITPQFSVDYGAGRATAKMSAAPIQHTLEAGGNLNYILYTGPASTSVTFAVGIQ